MVVMTHTSHLLFILSVVNGNCKHCACKRSMYSDHTGQNIADNIYLPFLRTGISARIRWLLLHVVLIVDQTLYWLLRFCMLFESAVSDRIFKNKFRHQQCFLS